jgi:hypothetical protein
MRLDTLSFFISLPRLLSIDLSCIRKEEKEAHRFLIINIYSNERGDNRDRWMDGCGIMNELQEHIVTRMALQIR